MTTPRIRPILLVAITAGLLTDASVSAARPAGPSCATAAPLISAIASRGGTYVGPAVALSGQTLVVGVSGKNEYAGIAYVFERSGDGWTKQATLRPADGQAMDEFGASVAIDGSTVVIGAYGRNELTGVAYVFHASNGSWTQTAELSASDARPNDAFGISVGISGSTALIGAPGAKDETGSAYAFTDGRHGWTQRAELTASDGAAFDHFGGSVAIDGRTSVIGASLRDRGTGAAYVFGEAKGQWSQQAVLTAADGHPMYGFGESVALDEMTVVVGAPFAESCEGAAYVFGGSGGTWWQRAQLLPRLGAPNDFFGWKVALKGSTAAVGAVGANGDTGVVHIFYELAGYWWNEVHEVSEGAFGNEFGVSVALQHSTLVAGGLGRKADGWRAYVFVRGGGTWSQQAHLP
jgi:hypothetical protein